MNHATSPSTGPAAAPIRPLRWPEMLGYGMGDVGFGFYWKAFELVLFYFYTDIFGISPAQVGTLMLVTRISDAVTDPLMGVIADRTRTRWGRFRPYLIWMALPLAAAGVLTFTTPDLDGEGKLVYAYFTYVFMMVVYTAANIPYGAMLGVITGDVAKRTTLSTYKLVCAFVGGAIIAKGIFPISEWLGGGNEALGWQRTMMLFGALAAALLVVAFWSTRERVAPPANQKTSVKQDLADLARNGPWLTLFALGFIVILTISIRNTTFAYYMEYVVGRVDLRGDMLFWSQVPMAVGAGLTPLYSKYFDKRRLFMLLMVGVALLSVALYFTPPENITMVFALTMAVSFVLGPKSVLTWAMFGDAADYSEWKTGRRATGLIFAASTFSVKLGGAIAGTIVGALLTSTGYVPNQAQTPEAIEGITLLATLIPGGCALVAALVIFLYRLDGPRLVTIQRELEDRRLAAKAAEVAAES